ncbi:MAG: hypothetical protein R3D69_16950 [Xanthobacteraceae bacterium]
MKSPQPGESGWSSSIRKTRPVALFWDQDALLTASVSMVLASGGVYWRVMNR